MGFMERSRGIKFRTVLLAGHEPTDARAHELVHWCHVFQEEGFSPPGENAVGNLSARCGAGFLITPANVPFASLGAGDLVRVVEVHPGDGWVLARGTRDPSSESMLHHAIYQRRPDVRAVFHGHCDDLLVR